MIMMPSRYSRLLALTLCCHLFGGLQLHARSGDETIKVSETQLRSVSMEAVEARRFRPQKFAIGHLAFNEDTSTVVFPPFAGRVTKVLGKIGDEVDANTPLFEIDSPEVVQMQTEFIAALNAAEKARAQKLLTKRVLDRQTTLVSERAAAMRELDQAQADHAAAEADLRTAEGAVAAARNRIRVLVGRSDAELERIERERLIDPIVLVRSPIAGQIVTRKVGQGQLVRPDSGEALYGVADLSTMWLRAAISENDIASVRVGQELEVRIDAVPKKLFSAKITAIGAASDALTHRVMVRSELANPDRTLRPEMFASFRIFVGEGQMHPTIRIESVIREGDRAFVYVEVKKQEFQRRPVILGPEESGLVAVYEGLKIGEAVVGRGAIFIDNEWKQ